MRNYPAKNPLDKLTPVLKMDLDRNLCVCNEVLKMDIINAIVNGATTDLCYRGNWLLHPTGRAVD